jgi:pimeloyl-ACP methyl ester carboxylesterase
MASDTRKHVNFLIVLVVVIAFSAVMAHLIERDFGKVTIENVRISDPSGVTLAGKLYIPDSASVESPKPGVLNLHGYQNDKDVQGPFSIELSRRGFVVLALDAFGHGDSGGALGMNEDPTNGTNTGYLYLKSLPFVDAANLASMGHSMGGMESVAIGAINPDHKALNPHASLPGTPELNNVLVTQARYDEFTFFREFQLRTEELTSFPSRLAALGLEEPIEWDTTYGDFDDGSARRMAFINLEHHYLTLNRKAVAEAADWFRMAMKDGATDADWIDPYKQIFLWKELFGGVTLIGTMITLIPLTNIFLATTYFAPVAQRVPSRYRPSRGNWWLLATINALIGGITYPILTRGGSFAPAEAYNVREALHFMRLQMGNGVALWFFVNAVIAFVLFVFWYRTTGKKANVTMYDMGVSFDTEKTKFDWGILGKTVLLGAILFSWMYILEGISQWALGQEFRFAWPFMRQFSEPRRLGYFFIYLIPTLLFFLVNGGIFLFGQAGQKERSTPTRTQWGWWVKILYAALFGLLLVLLFQYLPWMVFGQGPGFESILSNWVNADGVSVLAKYSGIWPLMLLVYIPQFAILLWFLTWFYRRTGRIYLGALMIAALAMWFMTAGTIIGI